AASKDRRARMGIAIFVCPLGYVADQIENTKWACSLRESRYVDGRTQGRSRIYRGKNLGVPVVPPRIGATAARLRCVLPLPLMGKAFPAPGCVCAGILDRYPCDGLVIPTLGIAAILPGAQEVVIVFGRVVRRVQESLELSIGHWRPIDIETMNVHAMAMEAARRIFPRILHICPGIVAALDFNTAHLKVVVCLGNAHHSFRR